jgi:hypothetical protein
MLTVYVAGPYASAPIVRSIHEKLCAIDCLPTSQWAENAAGPENFADFTPSRLNEIAVGNYLDLESSDAIFVFDPQCLGQETLCELGHALCRRIPAVVVRPKPLSRWRHGVVRAETLGEALDCLAIMARLHAQGIRHLALATGVPQ